MCSKLSEFLSVLGLVAVFFIGTVPAQRLLVTADNSSSAGMHLSGYQACTGQSDGLFVPFGSGGLASPRCARSGPDGHIYVASEVNNNVLDFDANGAFVRVFVVAGSGGLSQPYALDFGPDGNLYVTSQSATQGTRVLRYNGTTGAFLGIFAMLPNSIPRGLVFGPNGNLFVSSHQGNVIYVCQGTTGALVQTLSGNLNLPVGLAIGVDGQLYVANSGSNSVASFNATTGTSLGLFIPPGSGGLSSPRDIAIDPKGNLLIASYIGGGIREYDGGSGAYLGLRIPTNVEPNPLSVTIQWPRGVKVTGRSTAGCVGRPCIGVTSAPVLGNSNFGIHCFQLPPFTAGALGISTSALTSPSFFAGAEIWINTGPPFLGLFPLNSDASGRALFPLPLSLAPQLANLQVFAQMGWPEGCTPGGLAASRALDLTVQGLAPACPPEPGAFEPNNSCSAAALISSMSNLSAFLCPQGDQDWYRFVLPTAGTATLQLTPPSSPCLDYDLRLFGSCGTQLASSIQGSCGTEILNQSLTAGTYNVLVSGANGAWSSTAPYALSVGFVGAPITTVLTSSGPVSFSYSSFPIYTVHPNLQHVFTPTVPETVSVVVSTTALQMASCLSPWMYVRIRANNTVIAQGSLGIGTNSTTLSGTFSSIPNQPNAVNFMVSFNCPSIYVPQAQVPPAGGTATMTLVRTPL